MEVSHIVYVRKKSTSGVGYLTPSHTFMGHSVYGINASLYELHGKVIVNYGDRSPVAWLDVPC